MTTIMVSPIARETASKMLPTIPGSAAGRMTRIMVSTGWRPDRRSLPALLVGTAVITSSESDDERDDHDSITTPAASALSEEIDRPIRPPLSRMNGATVRAAKNP